MEQYVLLLLFRSLHLIPELIELTKNLYNQMFCPDTICLKFAVYSLFDTFEGLKRALELCQNIITLSNHAAGADADLLYRVCSCFRRDKITLED